MTRAEIVIWMLAARDTDGTRHAARALVWAWRGVH